MTARHTDKRRGDDRDRVFEHKFENFVTLVGAPSAQTDTFDEGRGGNTGNITRVLMRVGTNTSNQAAVLTFTDVDDFEVFNSGSKAKGADYIMDVDIPYVGVLTLSVLAGGNPGASGQIVTVKIQGE